MKILIALTLTLALVFGIGAAAMASPLVPLAEGQFTVFGEYASDAYIFDAENALVLGVGYGLTDSFTLGGEIQFHSSWTLYGLYAKLSFDPFIVSADFFYSTGGGGFYGKLVGLYMFDLDVVNLAVGGGLAYDDGDVTWLVEADASLSLSENVAINGSIGYNPDGTVFQAGLSITF